MLGAALLAAPLSTGQRCKSLGSGPLRGSGGRGIVEPDLPAPLGDGVRFPVSVEQGGKRPDEPTNLASAQGKAFRDAEWPIVEPS